MRNLISLFVLTLIFTSCSDEKQDVPAPNEDATPTALLEEESTEENRSYFGKRSWKYEDDIIKRLFDEACEKDKVLRDLTLQIKLMNNDTLKAYFKYSSTNKDYWHTSENYIARINDSLLRASTAAVFEKMACDYEYRILDYSNLEETIYQRAINLEDQLILMQLMVTQPMINNYEVNEKPPIKLLEDLIKNYDDLINETKAYVE